MLDLFRKRCSAYPCDIRRVDGDRTLRMPPHSQIGFSITHVGKLLRTICFDQKLRLAGAFEVVGTV